MTSGSSEQIIIENCFGIVTTKTVTYKIEENYTPVVKKTIPIKQVVSVQCYTDKMIFPGLFSIILGLVFLESIIGIIPLIFGIFMLWGFPTVNVVTTKRITTHSSGWPWQRKEAQAFTNALHNQLFKD
ncbi:MAG: hypothetical protein ACXITR_08550 [Cyanobacterium sp.]